MIDHNEGVMSFACRRPKRPGKLLAVAAPILLLVTGAAGFAARGFLDGTEWRTNAPKARLVSKEPSASSRDKREAIVILMRETQETIRALHAFAQDPEVALHAQRALEVITEASSK